MAGDGDSRFPPTMRLKKKTEFTRVLRRGVEWKGSCFSLHILKRAGSGPEHVLHQGTAAASSKPEVPRLGMVVTRKVGSAVERNRIKRKIREAFRKMAHRLPLVDLVIRPTAACKRAPEEVIARSLERAVESALEDVKERP
jgi:ribonuclease P protein component